MTKSLVHTHFGSEIEKQSVDLIDIQIFISPNVFF